MKASLGLRFRLAHLRMALPALVLGLSMPALSADCPPPAPWAGKKAIGAWRVGRLCTAGMDVLRVAAAERTRPKTALTVICTGAKMSLLLTFDAGSSKPRSGPVTLAMKGASPVLSASAVATDMGIPGASLLSIEIEDDAFVRRLAKAVAEGKGSSFTLSMTSAGASPEEHSFSRDGFSDAVAPLRVACGW